MSYIILSVVKFLDSMISTAKNITLYQNKIIASAILTFISQIIFFFVVSEVITDGSLESIIVVSMSAGLGSYIASLINNKLSKDRTFINVITSKNIDELKNLSAYLYSNHIKCILYDSYTRDGNPTYTIEAFAKTRNESMLINNYISKNNISCLREIID